MLDDFQTTDSRTPDAWSLSLGLNGSPAAVATLGSHASRFEASLMVPELRSSDRMGAIKELVDRMHQGGWVTDSLRFLQLVLEREDLESTVVTPGVAFPHARTRSVERLGAAVGVSRDGIDFESEAPSAPVHLVCLFAIPEYDAPSYLSLLADVSKRFRDAEFRRHLLASRSSEEMSTILSRSFGENGSYRAA